MSTKSRIPHAVALDAANILIGLLRPACERIEIAGSIRRGLRMVKDVELVLQPRMVEDPSALFGGELVAATDAIFSDLMAKEMLRPRILDDGSRRWGPKCKFADFDGIAVDLFIVTPPAQWGCVFLIRTGPYLFGRWLMTTCFAGGGKPRGFEFHEGALYRDAKKEDGKLVRGTLVPTPEEADVFAALNMDYIEPGQRQGPAPRGGK